MERSILPLRPVWARIFSGARSPARDNANVTKVSAEVACAKMAVGDQMGDERQQLSTHQKALKINLDALRYGTFAEIGAGQEVARWFFHVGAAAGTISKSVSAYDMIVSDAIYGPSKRYVSRERL